MDNSLTYAVASKLMADSVQGFRMHREQCECKGGGTGPMAQQQAQQAQQQAQQAQQARPTRRAAAEAAPPVCHRHSMLSTKTGCTSTRLGVGLGVGCGLGCGLGGGLGLECGVTCGGRVRVRVRVWG